VLAAGAATGREGAEVTLRGDALAFAAAVAVVGYLQVCCPNVWGRAWSVCASARHLRFVHARPPARDVPALPALTKTAADRASTRL
jgi:hypothetical protein